MISKGIFSKKNLWDSIPSYVKSSIGKLVGVVPTRTLLGKKFRDQYRFVKESEHWDKERVDAYQLSQLRSICRWAYEQSDFYHESFNNCSFDPNIAFELTDFQQLPFINKETITAKLSSVSVRGLNKHTYDYVSTGGTGGTPFGFYIDTDRSYVEFAHLVAGWERTNYKLGSTVAVIRGREISGRKKGMHYEYDPVFRNHYYSGFHLHDDDIKKYLKHLSSLGPCIVHGYPSSIDRLAKYVRSFPKSRPSNIEAILVESENVYSEQRLLAEQIFECRYFSSYGHTEKLTAAAECELTNNYHVWPTYGFTEIVDKFGEVINQPGQRGEIVATGFINKSTPFIRYRTGDYATIVDHSCHACGRQHLILKDIRGHNIQEHLVMNDGSLVSWAALNMHDRTFDKVKQFQFSQETPGLAVLNIVPRRSFVEKDKSLIIARLQNKLDGRLQLELKTVGSIPLTKAGKSIYVDQKIKNS